MSEQTPVAPEATNNDFNSTPEESNTKETTASESAPKESSKYKAIIDGVEEEVNPEDLVKEYQKYKSSDKRFKEAAELRKQTEEMISQLQPVLEAIQSLEKDPWALHKSLGVNYDELATNYAYEKALKEYEAQNMSPEEKRIKQLEEKLNAYENEYKKRKELEEQEANKRKEEEEKVLMQKAVETIDSDIMKAISESGVKPSERLVARMAEEMHNYLVTHGELLSAKEALHNVRNEVKNYSTDDLLALLSEEALEKLMNHKLSKKVGKEVIQKQSSQQEDDAIDLELKKFFKVKK